MKYKLETRTRTVMHGPVGQERPVQQTVQERVPVLPRDWDALAIRAGVFLVGLLTLIAVAWSTVSIGALLHGLVGYCAALLFDLAWLVNVLLEWLARYDSKKRRFSQRLGWGLLAVTMGAIAWHGLISGGVAMAIVGSLVSAFAKILWMGIMKFIHRELSDLDQQWVEQEVSGANALLAISGVRRMAARAQEQATLEHLAAERTRRGLSAFAAEFEPEQFRTSPHPEDDATTSRRRDAVTSSGEEADVRPVLASGHVIGTDAVSGLRPETMATLRQAFGAPAPVEEPEEEPEPVMARPSLAAAVRTLVDSGVTDPKVITAAVPALIGRTPKPESVAREIRAARARQSRTSDTGLYL